MRRPKAIFQPVFLPVASLKANDSAEFGFGARLSMPLQFRLKGRPDVTYGLLGHENYGMTKTLVCCPLVICCSRNIRIYRAVKELDFPLPSHRRHSTNIRLQRACFAH